MRLVEDLLEEVLSDWGISFHKFIYWSWVSDLSMFSSHGGECVHVFGFELHLFELGGL
jgi:predicted SpoU family rRNA methylase